MSVIGRPRTWTDEQFVLIISTAKHWSDVARGLGIKPTGKAYCRFRALAAELSVDTSHLRSPRDKTTRFCKNCSKPLPSRRRRKIFCNSGCDMAYRNASRLARWLQTGEIEGIDPGPYIRQYLLKEQQHACAICGMKNTWAGQLLIFILDHVDGNAQHNHRKNLRLICPNCDSQLPTYKGRNCGNGRHSRRTRYAAGKSY